MSCKLYLHLSCIKKKVFCREKDLEIITLSVKITFFFHNFYYILPFRNMTIRINHAFLVLFCMVLQLCLSNKESEPSLVAINLLNEGTLSCFVLLNVQVLVNVYMYITCNNGHPNMALRVSS